MLGFFAQILGGKKRNTSQPQRMRQALRASINIEELTPRVLPSASPWGLAVEHGFNFGHAANISTTSSNTSGDSDGCGGGGGSSASDSRGDDGCNRHGATLTASLSNSNGATGTANFNATTGTLFVKVSGASTGAALAVAVNGTTVGTLNTNNDGEGYVKLTGVTAQAGQTVTVGDLTGTLTQIKFSASLTGTAGASGNASFNTENSRLKVSVTGAAANTTYNVSVDNTVVGQLTTNKHGKAHLNLALTNVTVQTGTTISIADTAGNPAIVTGTFA